MLAYWIISGAILGIYSITILSFAYFWSKTPRFISVYPLLPDDTFISVVIALRNEEGNLKSLLESLEKQDLNKSCFEVLLIDDHSSDNTKDIATNYAQKHSWIRVMAQDDHLQGKKYAINKGIEASHGELIAFTDGDCTIPSTWLSTLHSFYQKRNKPDFIIGLVDLYSYSLLQKFFRLDFLSLILSGAGAASLSRPIFCNAANMAVKKTAINHKIYASSIASGDDVFLLHQMKANKKQITLLKSPAHLIKTGSPTSLSNFFEQRKRWASKAQHYTDRDTLFIAYLILLANIAFICVIGLTFLTSNYWPGITLLLVKFMCDFLLFISGNRFFQLSTLIPLIPFLSIIHPFYIVITAVTSLKSPFEWKGRKYSK